jgi:hypothetical protein
MAWTGTLPSWRWAGDRLVVTNPPPTFLRFVASILSYTNTSQIIAVNTADGTSIVYSVGPIPGVVSGTPRITEDQLYLIVTSNSAQNTRGHFTVWDLANSTSPLYQYDAPRGSEPQPFGPIGYYWSPVQGFYEGGFDNPNDLFIWGVDNELSDPAAGIGQIHAFQFPVDVTDGLNSTFRAELNVTLVGESRSFQNPTAPVFADQGLRMYWTTTRNEVRCWIGEVNVTRNSFDKRPQAFTEIAKDESNRGSTGMASPVVTENAVFGPLAANQIFRADPLCQAEFFTIITTNASVTTKILPSLDEEFIFFATVEPDAKLYMMNASSLESVWEYQLDRGVEADMALSPDGTTVYVASAGGVLEAVTVAQRVAGPTGAPTLAAPGPTSSPTGSSKPSASPKPTSNTTDTPTREPLKLTPTGPFVMPTAGGRTPSASPVARPTGPASSGVTISILTAAVLPIVALF